VSHDDSAVGRSFEIDAVITGAVANDGAQSRQRIHNGRRQRRPACGDHRSNIGKLLRREDLGWWFARGIQQFKTLANPHHHRLWKTRIDQDFEGHQMTS
jgi:hypothetical protein